MGKAESLRSDCLADPFFMALQRLAHKGRKPNCLGFAIGMGRVVARWFHSLNQASCKHRDAVGEPDKTSASAQPREREKKWKKKDSRSEATLSFPFFLPLSW
ncbi:hypothetical protein, partial [Herbaspirillum chlorophenolicum]|uniref:hypothetical protein n=1 Tax=Herbaspirillum chlorophenolicum TaxID=211589 RepID=UPI000AC2226E